jgi:hypothetical protein
LAGVLSQRFGPTTDSRIGLKDFLLLFGASLGDLLAKKLKNYLRKVFFARPKEI